MAATSLLLIVVALSVFTTVISTLGASTINTLLWAIYSRFTVSKQVAQHAALRREVLEMRKTLAGTSSQDEFAKWAKVRRTLDKKQADLEKLHANLQSLRSSFDAKAGVARWCLTSGMRLLLQFWYSKKPMFWLPKNWVPWYVEWGMSFPRAPMGSVSIQVWAFAVGQVVTLVFAIGTWLFESVMLQRQQVPPMQTHPEKEAQKEKKAN